MFFSFHTRENWCISLWWDHITVKIEKSFQEPLLIYFKLPQGAQSVAVIAFIWMPINRIKMFLSSAQLPVRMLLENVTIHAHRMWETKDYPCCDTDKSTGQQTNWVTCLSSSRAHTLSQHHCDSYSQVHPSLKRKFKLICNPGFEAVPHHFQGWLSSDWVQEHRLGFWGVSFYLFFPPASKVIYVAK